MKARALTYLIALSCVGILVLLRAWDPAPVEIARNRLFDAYQAVEPRTPQQLPVVIVDVDEESLAAYGQWPWPRTLLADIVTRLTEAGILGIGFNMLFPEADRTSPEQWITNAARIDDALLMDVLAALPRNDAVFAEALERSRVVLGQSTTIRAVDVRTDEAAPRKAAIVKMGTAPDRDLFNFLGVARNIPELEAGAKGLGMVTLAPDLDEIVRRIALVLRVDGEVYPSLALELLRVVTGDTTLVLKGGARGLEGVIVGGFLVPTDKNGRIRPRFAARDPARLISAKDLLDGQVPRTRLAGRLALVGTTAAGFLDFKGTPVDDAMPSVEIQAQAIEVMLSNGYLSRPDYLRLIEFGAIPLLGLLMLVRIPRLHAMLRFISGIPVMAGMAVASWYLYRDTGQLLDLTFPAFSWFILFTVLVSNQFLREEAQKKEVRRAFSQYISPALVERLASDSAQLNLGGETREMSILFCDIRDFTHLSEELRDDPAGLTRILNMYFTSMTDRILENGGTIDKYMGDAVMAFWNAPVDDPDHARHACEAALEMLDGVSKLNRKLAREAEANGRTHTPIRIGIGLNSGRCLVGNIGSDHRFTYSVIGDAVNVASRLEGQCKTYGVTVILGEETSASASGLAVIELDLIRVMGRDEPARIFALLGPPRMTDTEAFQRLDTEHAAMLTAYRGQRWAEARGHLAAARETGLAPPTLHALFEARIDHFEHTPPPPDWDGVFVADAK